jgi:transposase
MSVRGLSEAERRSGASGRRRRSYTVEQKRELVEETMRPGASVSVVAQRHDVNANLLFTWRRQMHEGRLAAPATAAIEPIGFIPLGVVGGNAGERTPAGDVMPRIAAPLAPGRAAQLEPKESRRGGSRIDVELPNGVRLRLPDAIDAAALRRVIAVLKDAW